MGTFREFSLLSANEMSLTFTRISYARSRTISGSNECFLVDDGWDDFGYKTLFSLIYFDESSTRHDLGSTRIMKRGMAAGRVDVEEHFLRLGREYVSLGTDQKFYENIYALGADTAESILKRLRDAAWDLGIYARFEQEKAFATSLMRSLRARDVERFGQIARGEATPTPFSFEYIFPNGTSLDFQVQPNSLPPTNIHTIIGRNGVGKTRLLKTLTSLLCEGESDKSKIGQLTFRSPEDLEADDDGSFANLIVVAFSAFDEIEFPATTKGTKTGIQLSYIGLRRPARTMKSVSTVTQGVQSGPNVARPKTQLKALSELTTEFAESLLACLRSSRRSLWLKMMEILESDPLFGSMLLLQLADAADGDVEPNARKIFDRASSGHKIVLLTVTKLVELVEERTLILIDEPEAHLHPPLQASFIRALSSLLTNRNGVALLATHSPVMLQEVPRSCVWLLFREGLETSAERPTIETFAENVGVLTREVFRVEVTQSGYHKLLQYEIDSAEGFEEVFAKLGQQVGLEGRAVARSLWRSRQEKADTE